MTYFAQNLKHLRKRSAKTQEQLGHEVHLGRTTIANYESGFSSPTDPDVLVRLSELFAVSIDELLTRDLSQAFAPPLRRPAAVSPARHDGEANVARQPAAETRVPLVRSGEGALYAAQHTDTAYVNGLPSWGLPDLSPGEYRIFEVADNALAPRFTRGDHAFCRRLDPLDNLRDGAACFLLCDGHGLLLRRVLNRLPAAVHLLCDAAGNLAGTPAALPPGAIHEAWEVEWIMSRQLDAPLSQVYSKIAELEQQLRSLSSRLGSS